MGVEARDPALVYAGVSKAHRVALPQHAVHYVADAAPRTEPAVQEANFARRGYELEKAQRSGEKCTTPIRVWISRSASCYLASTAFSIRRSSMIGRPPG
jgi:hypothetical protein